LLNVLPEAIDEPGLPPELLIGEEFFELSGFRSVRFEVKDDGAGLIKLVPAFLSEL